MLIICTYFLISAHVMMKVWVKNHLCQRKFLEGKKGYFVVTLRHSLKLISRFLSLGIEQIFPKLSSKRFTNCTILWPRKILHFQNYDFWHPQNVDKVLLQVVTSGWSSCRCVGIVCFLFRNFCVWNFWR